MQIVTTIVAVLLIVVVTFDGFEAIVLPRQVTRGYRPARLFYRMLWLVWPRVAAVMRRPARRQYFLSIFGPLSLLALFATWAFSLIFAFGLLQWSLGTPLKPLTSSPTFGDYLYVSGETFFTLGYGDFTADSALGKALFVLEAGVGFGFMAIMIGYLPVLYQAFSQREIVISMLDARAGSPPTAAQFLSRLTQCGGVKSLDTVLSDWERWSATVLESHLSFPVLSFYRSQHDNQSWLAALTTMLDTCALLLSHIDVGNHYQVQVTFAMARHTAVDLALVFKTSPLTPETNRLDDARLAKLIEQLHQSGLPLLPEEYRQRSMSELREMYEPFVAALGKYFYFDLPEIYSDKPSIDNWQSSAWKKRTPGIGKLVGTEPVGDHFE